MPPLQAENSRRSCDCTTFATLWVPNSISRTYLCAHKCTHVNTCRTACTMYIYTFITMPTYTSVRSHTISCIANCPSPISRCPSIYLIPDWLYIIFNAYKLVSPTRCCCKGVARASECRKHLIPCREDLWGSPHVWIYCLLHGECFKLLRSMCALGGINPV